MMNCFARISSPGFTGLTGGFWSERGLGRETGTPNCLAISISRDRPGGGVAFAAMRGPDEDRCGEDILNNNGSGGEKL